jgi:anti-sigma regulatory factor (Ser/Thr protein kinase)
MLMTRTTVGKERGKSVPLSPFEVMVVAWSFSLRLETNADSLRAVRRLIGSVVRQEGGSDAVAREVELALGEALSNARGHAYGGGVGPLEIDVAFEQGKLTLTVHDHGQPIVTTLSVPDDLPPKGRGGRGLFLIGRLMDEVEVMTRQGTSVRMRKDLD